MIRKKVIVSDLDGTLANNSHREHMLPADKGKRTPQDWEAFFRRAIDDTPMPGCIAALWLHVEGGLSVHIVSGRSDTVLDETCIWLAQHKVPCNELRLAHYDRDKLAPVINGMPPNARLKVDYIRELRERGLDPVLMYEDDRRVAEIIEQETGVPVVLVTSNGPGAGN